MPAFKVFVKAISMLLSTRNCLKITSTIAAVTSFCTAKTSGIDAKGPSVDSFCSEGAFPLEISLDTLEC